MVQKLVSKQNLLIRDIAPSRAMEGKTVLSIENDDLIADSPTTMLDSSLLN